MMEKQPQTLMGNTGRLERGNLRPVQIAQDLIADVHRQPVQRIFREHHQIERRHPALGLSHHRNDPLRLRRDIRPRLDHRQLQLHQPDHHPVRRFVQPAQTIHRTHPFRNKPYRLSYRGSR